MPLYLSQFDNQPKFQWDLSRLSCLLGAVRYRQGRLLGQMEMFGGSLKGNLPKREGNLPVKKWDLPRGTKSDLPVREKDPGHYLTEEILLTWHGGPWRHSHHGAAHIVHRSSPDIPVLRAEVRKFLNWFNSRGAVDPVLKAAIAHLWLLVIRPFDEGNERIAHLVSDIQLGHAGEGAEGYYDLSAQIHRDGATYDGWVSKARQGVVEITGWLEWWLGCLDNALTEAEREISMLVEKSRFVDRFAGAFFNDRQQLMITKLMEAEKDPGGIGNRISSSQWASAAGCSQDTALRDIQDLCDRSILTRQAAGGRSTQYILREPGL